MLIQQLIISHHHLIFNHIAIQGRIDFFYNLVKTIFVPITFFLFRMFSKNKKF